MATDAIVREGRHLLAEQEILDRTRDSAREKFEAAAEKPWSPENEKRYRSAKRVATAAYGAAEEGRGRLIRFLAQHNLTTTELR